jgi:cyclase
MLKRRLIPVLFVKDGFMVRSERFMTHNVIGHPISHVERLSEWDVDELILLDISAEPNQFDVNRSDHNHGSSEDFFDFIRNIAKICAVPMTIGGHIAKLEDIAVRIHNGADKVSINTAISYSPELITEAALIYGSQAIVVSIDYKVVDGDAIVFTHRGRVNTGTTLQTWAEKAIDLGAGELFINSIDRDGTAIGYDIKNINALVDRVNIPVIACGGAGHQSHFLECYSDTTVSAVAAGNIFHFTENAYPRAKQFLRLHRADVR